MWTGQKFGPVLSRLTQPLMGWTGQTRRLMWTGQEYRPVRVKMTSLLTMTATAKTTSSECERAELSEGLPDQIRGTNKMNGMGWGPFHIEIMFLYASRK